MIRYFVENKINFKIVEKYGVKDYVIKIEDPISFEDCGDKIMIRAAIKTGFFDEDPFTTNCFYIMKEEIKKVVEL